MRSCLSLWLGPSEGSSRGDEDDAGKRMQRRPMGCRYCADQRGERDFGVQRRRSVRERSVADSSVEAVLFHNSADVLWRFNVLPVI